MSEIIIFSGGQTYYTADNFGINPVQMIEAPFEISEITVDTEKFIDYMMSEGLFYDTFKENDIKTTTIGMNKYPVVFERRYSKETKSSEYYLTFKDKTYLLPPYQTIFIRCGEVFTARRLSFYQDKKPSSCYISFIDKLELRPAKKEE